MSHPQLAAIQRIISESLLIPADSISEDDLIVNLKNIDSLSFEMIVVSIENETDKLIDPDNLLRIKTVKDLALLLEQLKS
ncbi:acyl carrier protein [Lampropedia aestuarii]|uniref:acyl carrier protein n=1 Tax=Lampropedia aestuarii TaxID=2562762 RepID=UPI0024695992|nr:acyl carrier protein [Lampropedia aestuarii]MDH5855735.1 acyl carrier protein [Lampropedia aestuarii]